MKSVRRILFVNYTYSFTPHAHNGCLLTMLDRLLGFAGDPARVYHLVSLNVRRRDAEQYAGHAEVFLGKYAGRLTHALHYRSSTAGGGLASLRELIMASLFIRRYVQQHGIDTVYAYGETALFALGLVSLQSVKLFADIRGNFLAEEKAEGAGPLRLFVNRFLLSQALPRAEKIFVISSQVGSLARQWNRQAPLVPNANYYDDRTFQIPSMVARQSCTFVYAGGAQKYQALPELFRLFRVYDQRYGPAHLLLLINGDHHAVRQWLDQAGVPGDRVTLKIAASPDEVALDLNRATYGCMPRDNSQGSRDALPVKLAEYLACGLPVIAFRTMPAATEIIEQNQLGVVVDIPGDYEQAAGRINDFITSHPDIHERCSAFAQKELSWSAHAARIHREIIS